MIILDTNVLSELTRLEPSRTVLDWLRRVSSNAIHTTSITRAETLLGLKQLPDGARKADLSRRTEVFFSQLFQGRVLPFDHDAATYYPEIVLSRRMLGRPISSSDAMIAAIAIAHGFDLATRNVRDFEDTGVTVLNPFEDAA